MIDVFGGGADGNHGIRVYNCGLLFMMGLWVYGKESWLLSLFSITEMSQ